MLVPQMIQSGFVGPPSGNHGIRQDGVVVLVAAEISLVWTSPIIVGYADMMD